MKTDQSTTVNGVRAEDSATTDRRQYESPAMAVLGTLVHLTEAGLGADMDLTSSQPT